MSRRGPLNVSDLPLVEVARRIVQDCRHRSPQPLVRRTAVIRIRDAAVAPNKGKSIVTKLIRAVSLDREKVGNGVARPPLPHSKLKAVVKSVVVAIH